MKYLCRNDFLKLYAWLFTEDRTPTPYCMIEKGKFIG